jgi:hypothetical protein
VERDQLEHVLRAAAAITREDEFIVVGSQAILGAVPDAPADLKISREVDLYPRFRPELAELIDGALGEASHFDDTFGYHARGVGEETAAVPEGWQDRLVRVQTPATRGAIGWCLDPHDLVVSKYVANRDKDRVFCRNTLRHRIVHAIERDADTVPQRCAADPACLPHGVAAATAAEPAASSSRSGSAVAPRCSTASRMSARSSS